MKTLPSAAHTFETVEQLNLVIEVAGLGLWDLRPQTSEMFVSHHCFTMAGYAPGELSSTLDQWGKLVHPEDLEGVTQEMMKIWRGECETVSVMLRLLTKYGDPMWVLSKGKIFQRDSEGNPLRILGTQMDIDAWIKSEAEKHKYQKQYENLVENAHTGIFIAEGGIICYANPSIECVSGYAREELIGKPFKEIVHDEDKSAVMRRDLRGREGVANPDFYAVRIVNKNGKVRWIEANSMPFEWEGRPAILVFLRDVTLAKALESQHLQSQKIQAIGTMAGGIAHDFNNILSAIMGYTEISVMEANPGSRMAQHLDRVMEAACRARDLVGQILALGRQEEAAIKPVNLALIAKEVAKFIRASTPTHIDIVKDIDLKSGAVMADPTRLHQVLMNLCTNAVHAMRDSGGTLKLGLSDCTLDENDHVTMVKGLAPGNYVHLVVSDTGHGMSQETMKKIFDPYFTTKPLGEGTGLGLSVAHGIVTSLGGTFHIYSEPGKGSAFHVYLPRLHSRKREKAQIVNHPLIIGGTETILLVDDEAPVLDMTREILETLGYNIIHRRNGLDAFNVFAENPQSFDLIITDQVMPQMTGIELAGRIRELDESKPIILCSGFGAGISAQSIADYGLGAVLNKPLLIHEIAAAIRQVLD